MTAELKRSLLILTAVTLVTAWFSALFYFPDEHYQVLEFMSHKLGITPAAALPWEFTARIRPWTQPLIYYAIARPLLGLGVSDLFTILWILRLLTGLFSLATLAAFARALLPTLPGDVEKRAFLRYLPLFGFLPYLFVRTSSETFSAAFFALGLALAMGPQTAARLALAGLLCGLAFECRYQTALMTLGLFAWLAIVARVRIAALGAFIAGGVAALALGALADRWGYGVWVFPPFDYFNVNILQGVAARTFGREPFFAYFYLLPATGFFAITLVVMAGMIAMWLRNPRHPVSWASLPFVALHVAVAHKEARFLFPLAILATSFPVLGFSPLLPRGRHAFARIWQWRHSWAAKATTALSLVFMAYLAVYPFGVRPHMPMARYLYRHDPGAVVSLAPVFESYPMVRPAHYQPRQVSGPQLAALLDKGPVLFLSETPLPPPGIKATLLYSEFPLTRFGYGDAGENFIRGYTGFAAKARFLKLLPLHWYTLYRLERSATMRS
ncbi:MAG: Mannosyltransferase [Alphaproteobacteria bacterium]|nr:Mannosyltransferase [Alphaproteobacteria bacterium]